MSFLAPLYLLLGGAVAVPLLIHLLRRRIGLRVEFPAARYLARAERENSRTLRIRNLLLMLLRVIALLAIVVAAARPVARWLGSGHAPTAVAIVIDNSLSSSAVVNGRPLLDQFKAMARDVVSSATSADRLWLVTIDGHVRGGTASVLRDEINRMEPIAGAGEPSAALTRAATVVRGAGLDARQIALLTDGQRSEWDKLPSIADAQLLLYTPAAAPPSNRAVVLAEARPIRWTPRGTVAARILSRDSATYRVSLNGRTFARGTAAPNEEVVVRAAPPERGWVAGTVEIEADELAADNVRHFATWIGAAPGVAASPGVGPFVKDAIDVLRGSERVVDGHDIAVVGGDELTSLPALITPPIDPVKLGAANRGLERAGIPWRFGDRRAGEASVRGNGFDGVTTAVRYDLIAQSGAVAETLAVVGRDAWIVAGPRYVLIGSPLAPDATNFPVRASFVPWLGGVLTERLVGEPGQVIMATPGAQLPRPRWADAMEGTTGQRTPIGETLDVPTRAGTYFLTRGDRRVGAVVVNPPSTESVLDRYSANEIRDRFQAERALVTNDADAWKATAFRGASRRSLIEPALLLALVMLVIEAIVIGARGRRAA
ncbi:MAG TPA: BatA and WFA domain-containing protein [Gemmatimonadaceae bacterium]|nr:BatA and WFA domain-containing protein [Gemmatimonadaceae bacterium]